MRRALPLPLLALLAGCLTAHPPAEPVPAAPPFDPFAFFAGPTRGLGTLYVRGRAPHVVRVEGFGVPLPDGTFRLVQTVARGDGEPSRRTWLLRQTGPGRYAGTLSDAAGEISAEAEGSLLRVRYRMGAATTMTQAITLQPDGRTALNLSTVRVLGVPWARLNEQIRRLDGPVPGAPPPTARRRNGPAYDGARDAVRRSPGHGGYLWLPPP